MDYNQWVDQTKSNTKNLAQWTAAWVISMAVATFGPMFIWKDMSLVTLLAVVLNAGLEIGVILANVRHLNGLDALQKKIQLEGMAIALGIGIIGGLSYSLLDTTNLIAQDAEISYLVILISLTYLISVVIGQRRYK